MKRTFIITAALSGELTRKAGLLFAKTVTIGIKDLSDRTPYKTDANGNSVEGGALNANYTTVEAVAKVCNTLGKHGFLYGRDFVWTDQGWTDDMDDAIIFEYSDPKIITLLGLTK